MLYDDLPPAAQRLARVPRLGRLLALLPPERARSLARTATAADVFWELYTYDTSDGEGDCGLLADGLKVESARRLGYRIDKDPPVSFRPHQIRRACDLLGAIALELMACRGEDGAPQPAFNGVSDNLDRFKTKVQSRFVAAGALVDSLGRPEPAEYFFDDWDALMAMDSHGLKHFLFSTGPGDQALRWTDITTMAFFAAFWATRWANATDRTQMRAWIVDPLRDTNQEFHEFWIFAVDMPADAADPDRWRDLFSLFYDGPVKEAKGPAFRSTEFIYRSWSRMEAGKAPALATFLAEAPEILEGKHGRTKRSVLRKMLQGFLPLVKSDKPDDTGTFVMGAPPEEDPQYDIEDGIQDNPQHPVTLSPYALHPFCVTNAVYELFDPGHRDKRWGYGRHPLAGKPEEDVCPVVNVSWYDSWCLVKWLSGVTIEVRWPGSNGPILRKCRVVLPTEAQWEYACRTGRITPFTFHEDHPGTTCTADVCNFDGNYPFPPEIKDQLAAKARVYREATLPVQELGPNRWGFFQMHGNVWEWCADWSDREYYRKGPKEDPLNAARHDTGFGPPAPPSGAVFGASARVLRGGSWLNYARICRSAFRSRFGPGNRDHSIGFRLAAVPVVGAEQVQASPARRA